MEATQNIINQLQAAFLPLDKQVIESAKADAKKRFIALRKFRQSEEYKTLKGDEIYTRMFAIIGGATAFKAQYGDICENFVKWSAKKAQRTIDSRNRSIANKLKKLEIVEIISSEYAKTYDGFDGVYVVETNRGKKTIRIETIGAGGHNVQCYHLRVLIKIK